jgi:hypothetical protein
MRILGDRQLVFDIVETKAPSGESCVSVTICGITAKVPNCPYLMSVTFNNTPDGYQEPYFCMRHLETKRVLGSAFTLEESNIGIFAAIAAAEWRKNGNIAEADAWQSIYNVLGNIHQMTEAVY